MDPDLFRGTPYGKYHQPVGLGWWFVAVSALVLGLAPSIIVGLFQ